MPTQVEGPPASLSHFETGLDPDACLKDTVKKIDGTKLRDETLKPELNILGAKAVGQLCEGIGFGLKCERKTVSGEPCPYEAWFDNAVDGDTEEVISAIATVESCVRGA